MNVYLYKEWLNYWIDTLNINCSSANNFLYKKNVKKNSPNLILRHDIDACSSNDIKIIKAMAAAQEDKGVVGSYYLLKKHTYYEPNKLFFLELQKRGHEIGLHVDVKRFQHGGSNVSKNEAILEIKEDIRGLLEDGFNIETMAWHGTLDNKNARVLLEYPEDTPASYILSQDVGIPFVSDCCYFLATYKKCDIIPKVNACKKYIGNIKSQLEDFNNKILYTVIHPWEEYYKEEEEGLVYLKEQHRFWEDDPMVLSSRGDMTQSLSSLFLEKRKLEDL